MADITRRCAGCGTELTPMKYRGNPKKWCSERCRVKHYRDSNPEYRARAAEQAKRRAVMIEAAKPPKPRCENCGKELRARRTDWKYCGALGCRRAKIAEKARAAPRCTVEGCERPQQARGMCSSHCSIDWGRRNPERSAAGKSRYRARKRGAFIEDVDRSVVLDRDSWRCGICGERILKKAKWPHPKSASIDHIIPLNLGGKHEMKNVQAAHLRCNSAKSDHGAGDQLALIG